MHDITVYHNPRCSNSRGALALLRERGVEPVIVAYLENPPGRAALTQLFNDYEGPPANLVRFKEAAAAEAGLTEASPRDELIDAIVRAPVLLQRPIVRIGECIIVARPPNVLVGWLEQLFPAGGASERADD